MIGGEWEQFTPKASYIRKNRVDDLIWEVSELRIFIDNSQYDTNIDIFSYGILLIHIFSGKWPFPTKAVAVDPNDPDKLSPFSEAKCRQQYLDDITPDHHLMDLILKCISNSPTLCPTAAMVLQDVKAVESQFSPTGKEELLQRVKALSVSLKEVEERSKDQEQHTDETKAACKEVTSTLSSTPTPKFSDQEHQDHKRIVNQPQTSSPNQKAKKKEPMAYLVSMQTLSLENLENPLLVPISLIPFTYYSNFLYYCCCVAVATYQAQL